MNNEFKDLLINISYRFAISFKLQKFENINFDNRMELISLIKKTDVAASERLYMFYKAIINYNHESNRSDFKGTNLTAWLLKCDELKKELSKAFNDLKEYAYNKEINLDGLFLY